MRFLAFSAVLALASCAQQNAPVASQDPPPALALRPLSRAEPSAATLAAAETPPRAASEPPAAQAVGKLLIGGASLLHLNIRHNSSSMELQCVLFDSRSYALQVIDQPEDWSGGGRISACMRSVNAIAGVNGGFFTPEFAPMGLNDRRWT